MFDTIYYSIDNEVTGDSQDGLYATGNKTVTMYTLEHNTIESLDSLDLEYEDDSRKAILEYLSKNDWDSNNDKINLVRL